MAAAASVVAMVAAGFVLRPSDEPGQSAQAKAETRRFVLILAHASDQSESDRFEVEVAARTEALTSACMASHHLRYTPKDPRSVVDIEDASDFSSSDYARERGFGISVFPHFAPATADDAYLKTLSTADLKAYDARLSGCVDHAQRTTNREYGIARANAEWARIDDAVQHDPRYRSALGDWRACAAAAGHPAESRLSLIEALRKDYASVMTDVRGGGPTLPQDRLAAQAARSPGWQRFHQAEVDAATATFGCSQVTDRTYVSIFLEYLDRNG
ncbi:hypothetical protein ACFRCG_37380 [Embleya sp. NPDC056575]|uniref:hypothetical protein n=1 Tax=unclassified Embleya TaxID=2699296 RepID=UPI003678E83B